MKMMITADLHLSSYKKENFIDDIPETIYYVMKNLEKCVDEYKKRKCDYVVILGDIFHDKELVYSLSINYLNSFFNQYSDVNFIMITGNHDTNDADDNMRNLLYSFQNHENVKIIDKYELVDNCLFTSYRREQLQLIKDAMEDFYQPGEVPVLFGHFDIQEALMDNGFKINHGISYKDLKGYFRRIILGHIHKPQEIIEDDFELVYVGSPIQQNWGEKGQEKRIMYFDSLSFEQEFIPTEYKKFIEVKIDDEVTEENREKIIEQITKLADSGDHIRLQTNDMTELKSIIPEEFTENVKVLANIDTSSDRDVVIKQSDELIEKAKKWLKFKKVPEDKYDEYINVLLESVNIL